MAKAINKKESEAKIDFAFGKINYILMVVGVVIIFIGYLLMMGGKSEDPNVFNANEIFSFRRVTLAPIVVLLGFAFEIYAIMKKPGINLRAFSFY